MRRSVVVAVLAAGWMWTPAMAQTVTPDQAAGLERDLRGWVAGLLAPLVVADQVPLKVSPAGERYRLEMTVPEITGFKLVAPEGLVAMARPVGDRWLIDDVRMFPRLDVTTAPAGEKVLSMTMGEQRVRWDLDPTLKTASRSEAVISDLVSRGEATGHQSTTRVAKLESNGEWTPAGDGLMAVSTRMRMTGYQATSALPGDTKLTVNIREIAGTVRGDGVSPAGMGHATRQVAALAASIMANPSAAEPSAVQRTMMRGVLDALGGLFGTMESDQTFSGIDFASGDTKGTLQRARYGSRFAAPAGTPEFVLHLEVEGVGGNFLPKGPEAQLIPKRVALSPRVGGIPKKALMAFLSNAIDTAGRDDADTMGEAMAMLADNPAVLAIDGLDIELGMARLKGAGQVKIAAMDDISGTAELRMTGLDALIRVASKLPDAAMAMPILAMLKGMGEQSGGETVWNIVYSEGQVTVNGADLSAMMKR